MRKAIKEGIQRGLLAAVIILSMPAGWQIGKWIAGPIRPVELWLNLR